MGDIQTHAAIAAAVEQVLPSAEPHAFFELGNYLTDVSQFRDPFAHLSGKARIWDIGRSKHPEGFILAALDLFVGLDGYLDELMGVPGKGPREGTEGDPSTWRPDDGELAAWFRDVLLVYTTERFHRHGLAKADVLEVFNRRFTQYYPHEHLDFPPWPPESALGEERGRHSGVDLPDGSAKRRLLAYLDAQLEYVADLLARVETEWAQVAATPDAVAARRLSMAMLGHASHALEDYFFHSNFSEFAWAHLHPGDPAAPTRPMPPPSAEELDTIGPAVSDTHRKRIYYRRRRAPLADPDDRTMSKDASAEATEIFTGQFGANDIFFTFVDAIGHLLLAEPGDGRPGAFDLFRGTLRKLLFGTDTEQASELAAHNHRLKTGEYQRLARGAALVGTLESFEVDAIERACQRDLRLATRYSSVASGGTPLGILGMVQQLMAAARDAAKKSAEAAQAVDADASHQIEDQRTDNGVAYDTIGTHTLMSKDSVRKEPLRVETVNLATVAATFLGRTMAERQAAGAPTTPGGTDWAALLRAFAGHPDQVPGPTPWWQPALTSTAAADQIAPTVPTVAGDALATRAAEPHRRALEQRYEALSAGAEAAYRHKVNSAFVLDSTLTAGMLGGLSGLISGLVYGAEAGPAGKAVGAGALGLVSGAAAAMLGSLLITGVATAIDDHAGSTTGAIVSWAGSPVGAWFLGEVIADHL